MLTDDEFFLKTLNDIRQKGVSDDYYDILKACGLLRLLLVDSPTLVAIVNRKYKVDLTYYATKHPFVLNIKTSKARSISPLKWDLHTSKIDGFRAIEIQIIDDEVYTIRDFIYYGANLLGGVHRDIPSKSAPKAKLFYDFWMQKDVEKQFIRIIKEIITMGTASIRNLEVKVKEKNSGHTPTNGI